MGPDGDWDSMRVNADERGHRNKGKALRWAGSSGDCLVQPLLKRGQSEQTTYDLRLGGDG